MEGREGLLNEINEALLYVKTKIVKGNAGAKEYQKYVETLLKTIQTLYGQKIEQEGKVDINVHINIVGDEEDDAGVAEQG